MKGNYLKYHIAAATLLIASSCVTFINGYNVGVRDRDEALLPKLKQAEERAVNLDKDLKSQVIYNEMLEISVDDMNKKIASLNNRIKDLTNKKGKYKIDRFKITAYSPYENVSGIEHDGDADATSTGATPRVGTIAVDPKVIPYGSNIAILYDDGSTYYGKAEDCGGAIKGNRLDVFKWTYNETYKHGIKNATVIWWK